MGMALKVDVAQACKLHGDDRPIDLVYLSSQTMGDANLEAEILGMFAAQLPQYVDLIEGSQTKDEIYRSAHTLKGAARGIGAFELADVAASIEAQHHVDALALKREADRVLSFIRKIC